MRDPAARVARGAVIELQSRPRYVSRGGEKLHAALAAWSIPVQDKVFVDAGASTGGFTDCLLQSGARVVHAVDVGYNQLDYRLRCDSRVIVHERTNLMDLEPLEPPPDAAVADLSFRSLRGAARKLLSLTSAGWGIVLVKPQFELASALKTGSGGRGRRDRGSGYGNARGATELDAGAALGAGVIRDADVLREILLRLQRDLRADGVLVKRALSSPLVGRRGNREFLFLIERSEANHAGSEANHSAESTAQSVEQEIRLAVSSPDAAGRCPEGS